MTQYIWIIWSLGLAITWAVIYFVLKNKETRREMLAVSLWTTLLGLTEPLFVPEYWSPPSLFDMARRTGFDIESLIFAFSVGGIAYAFYRAIFRADYEKAPRATRQETRHRYHFAAVVSTPILFLILLSVTRLNPIYDAIIALMSGGIFSLYCRPDLWRKMIVSAFLFLGIYFIYFVALVAAYPGYVREAWNLKAISGILIFGVPLEELLFAFSFGFIWSGIYEHMAWRRVKSAEK